VEYANVDTDTHGYKDSGSWTIRRLNLSSLFHTSRKHVAKVKMKLLSLITPVCLVGMAASVELSQYSAESGVESAFKSFLNEYVVL
jgi:hypothetical protein